MFKKMNQIMITVLALGLFSLSSIAAEKAADAKPVKVKKAEKAEKATSEKPMLPACNFRISLS